MAFTKPYVAYFSMEIGLDSKIPTYSGGLGVLAGDFVRSSADLEIPLVAVTLVSKKGYFKQEILEDGKTIESTNEWDPSKFMTQLPIEETIKIQNRDVKIKAWRYDVKSPIGGTNPVLFLDTDVEGNSQEDREITHFLYGGDGIYRLKQELVLGIGGVKILDALSFDIKKYHMNEGHAAFLTLELLRKHNMDLKKVKEICVFTTHSIVYGHDGFSYDIVSDIVGKYFPLEILKKFGGRNALNMTVLGLNLSKYANGVGKRHRDLSIKLFPDYKIKGITNGVHSYTWTSESFRKIYDEYFPGWHKEPELLSKIDLIPNEKIWQAHTITKRKLIDYVNKETDVNMDYKALTIGFARRVTGYKRANLIFSDCERLKRVNHQGKIQIIFSGKAHHKDEQGKLIIKFLLNCINQFKKEIKIVYLEDYNIEIALKMIPGVDIWLNTPLPPFEASGTSGMKAAHNGVINFSTLDGWWIEGWIEGITGWAIGPQPNSELTNEEQRSEEIEDIYNKLEYIIVPTFYQKRDKWIGLMKNSIGILAPYFNSHRMFFQYLKEAYY